MFVNIAAEARARVTIAARASNTIEPPDYETLAKGMFWLWVIIVFLVLLLSLDTRWPCGGDSCCRAGGGTQ